MAALRYCKRQAASSVLAVVNVPESTMAREADARAADHRRARDRRRLDQGLHRPARRCSPASRVDFGRARGGAIDADEERGCRRRCSKCRARAADGAGARRADPAPSPREVAKARDVLYLGRGCLLSRSRWKAR
jgi:hypothetical protein